MRVSKARPVLASHLLPAHPQPVTLKVAGKSRQGRNFQRLQNPVWEEPAFHCS